MTAPTLTEFLLARIAEDEADARESAYEGQRWVPEEEAVVAADRDLEPLLFLDRKCDARHAARWSPNRVLAECEARRAAIEDAWGVHLQIEGEWGYGKGSEQLEAENDQPDVVRHLAAVYADHPDYDEAWQV